MNDKPEIKNAIIESTLLGIEDHGILSWMLHLKYGNGLHQGFGGYALDDWRKDLNRRVGTAWGMESISRVLETVGVGQWEKLPGERIRVEATWGKVLRIGHFMEDKWLSLETDLDFLKKP